MIQQQDFFIINVNNTTTLRKMVNTSLTLELKVNVEQLYTRRYARDRHDALPAASRNGPRAASGTARKCFRELHNAYPKAGSRLVPVDSRNRSTRRLNNLPRSPHLVRTSRTRLASGIPRAPHRRSAIPRPPRAGAASARPAEATARQRGNSHTRAGLGGESP